MDIVFFGTPDFAAAFLKGLYSDPEINIEAVVTQPDKPVGRKKEITPPPVKEVAREFDLTVLQPDKVKNNNEFIKLLKGLSPDFIIVVAYGEILPEEILNIPKYDCINVHTSLLPSYRGASPIQTALLNGDKETGLSIMKMDKELDTGDIYMIKKIQIEPKDNLTTLSDKLADIGSIVLPSALKDIQDEVLSPIPQDNSKASYCKKISKADAQINPEKEGAEKILNKFKAFTKWPGIFMIYNSKRLKILDAETSETKANPGELKEHENNLILGTKKGSLKLNKVQLEGKKPMSGKDFINGFLG